MRMGTLLSITFWALVAVACTGCATMGVRANAELYREDDVSTTRNASTHYLPLRCIWSNCNVQEVSHGS